METTRPPRPQSQNLGGRGLTTPRIDAYGFNHPFFNTKMVSVSLWIRPIRVTPLLILAYFSLSAWKRIGSLSLEDRHCPERSLRCRPYTVATDRFANI